MEDEISLLNQKIVILQEEIAVLRKPYNGKGWFNRRRQEQKIKEENHRT